MEEGEPIRIFIRFQCCFVHQAAHRKVGHHETIKLLLDQVRSFAAQHDLRATQMGFQFIQGGLDLPAFMVKRRQFCGRRRMVVQVTRR